jgi:hypothetical protein
MYEQLGVSFDNRYIDSDSSYGLFSFTAHSLMSTMSINSIADDFADS